MQRSAEAIKTFRDAMDDDLNTAEALAAVFEYIRDTNTAMDSGEFQGGNVAGAASYCSCSIRFSKCWMSRGPWTPCLTNKWKR